MATRPRHSRSRLPEPSVEPGSVRLADATEDALARGVRTGRLSIREADAIRVLRDVLLGDATPAVAAPPVVPAPREPVPAPMAAAVDDEVSGAAVGRRRSDEILAAADGIAKLRATVAGARAPQGPRRRPRIAVGGPPRDARHVRMVVVLRAAPLYGCAFPGSTGRRDDQADENGRALPVEKARPVQWTHLAHRAVLRDVEEQRSLERRVLVWQAPGGGWWVQVHDGWGQLVDDCTPVPYEFDDAREIANAIVDDLRAQAAAEPWRWVRA